VSVGEPSLGGVSVDDDNAVPRPHFLTIDPAAAEPEGFGPQSASWVEFAQNVYRQLIEQLDIPGWLEAPVGPLASDWKSATGQSATRLINLATRLNALVPSVDANARGLFKAKLQSLFRPTPTLAFHETLVELEVGATLSQSFEIVFEPLVPPGEWNSSTKPRSPDYGLRQPEGLVQVEVTVWHWEALAAWHRMETEVNRIISSRLRKRGIRRIVHLDLPIKVARDARETIASRQVCKDIASSESGHLTFDVGPRPAVLSWRTPGPPLHFLDEASIDFALAEAAGGVFTVGPVAPPPNWISHTFKFSSNPCLTKEDALDGLGSLRRSIDGKKDQGRHDLPYILAISLYGSRASWELFAPLVAERLWPNERYEWLSGVFAYSPYRLVPPFVPRPEMVLAPNPNASITIPESVTQRRDIFP
jgi:hypothetical protein